MLTDVGRYSNFVGTVINFVHCVINCPHVAAHYIRLDTPMSWNVIFISHNRRSCNVSKYL